VTHQILDEVGPRALQDARISSNKLSRDVADRFGNQIYPLTVNHPIATENLMSIAAACSGLIDIQISSRFTSRALEKRRAEFLPLGFYGFLSFPDSFLSLCSSVFRALAGSLSSGKWQTVTDPVQIFVAFVWSPSPGRKCSSLAESRFLALRWEFRLRIFQCW
jgi:hypothetical protein